MLTPDPMAAGVADAAATSGVGAWLLALPSGLEGAVLVALITMFYTKIRESRRNVAESAGLAKLLTHEVQRNNDPGNF